VRPVVPRAGQLRGHVLRPRLRHHARPAGHQVRVQVPVVLRCGVPGLRGNRGRAHVQATHAETRLAGLVARGARDLKPVAGPSFEIAHLRIFGLPVKSTNAECFLFNDPTSLHSITLPIFKH